MEAIESKAANHQRLEVIALVSGGKDSFYSLHHCLANGHQVIALANLYPPTAANTSDNQNDLNSYMYQTAGHALIPLYADALRLPLYRQEIVGGPTDSSKDYHSIADKQSVTTSEREPGQELDETESLLSLLRKVIEVHPTANAVCSGAILSTYQRTRIESVATRLNLIPLSYLWQYPFLPPSSPGGLLDDMAAVGFDIRIVKVASGGLDEELLWCNLLETSTRRKVERSVQRFGGSVLGEGGEYETIVIDGPVEMFKARIEVQDHEKWIGRGGGGEAWMGFRNGAGTVVKKDYLGALDMFDWKTEFKIPDLYDELFEALMRRLVSLSPSPSSDLHSAKQVERGSSWNADHFIRRDERTLTVCNLTGEGYDTTVGEQMSEINSKLLDIMLEHGCSDPNDVVFTTILLRSMRDFATVNGLYGQLFTLPNPPARVTVACGDTLPRNVDVMVSFIIDLGSSMAREGLHVQSRSYWAPANIGPYSQAICVPTHQQGDASLVYVAGQIPLIPRSMALLKEVESENLWSLFLRQACLSLQHLWRIGKAMSVGRWTGAVAFIAGKGDPATQAILAWQAWLMVHSRELWKERHSEPHILDGLDAWDRKYGGMGILVQQQAEEVPLPDFGRLSDPATYDFPGFFAVQVDELPRGSTIEWQSLGMTRPYAETIFYIPITAERIETEHSDRMLEIAGADKDIRVTIYTCRPLKVCNLDFQIIPCRAVWGPDGVRLAAGMVIQHGVEARQPFQRFSFGE